MNASEGFHGTAAYTLTALPDGSTRLDSDSRFDFDDGFAKFMTPLVMWQARKKHIADQVVLRTLIEGGK